MNVFVPPERRPEVEAPLAPLEHRDLVHLFFAEDALHAAMPAAVREIPFTGATLPLVAPEHLVVRKAILDRPKDWADVDTILTAKTPLDHEEIIGWLRRLAGDEDPRAAKLRVLLR